MDGFAGGVEAAVQTLSGLQQYQENKQLAPFRLEDASLTVQQKETTVASGKLQLQQQQKQLQMLSQLAASGRMGPGTAPEDQLTQLAQIDIASGNTNEAREKLNTASTIVKNRSDIAERNAQTETRMWTTISNLASSAHSPADWDMAKTLFASEHPDMMNNPAAKKIMEQPYSPQLISQLSSVAQTKLQAAQTVAAQARAAVAGTELGLNAARQKEAAANTDLAKARTENLIKSGGKNLIPKGADYNPIMDLAKQDYGDLADPEQTADIRSRSTRAVERMLTLERSGIPRSQAAQQAYAEAKRDGDFGGLKPRGSMGRPTSAAKPTKLPESKEKLVDNTWYTIGGTPKLYLADHKAFYTEDELTAMKEDDEAEDEGEQ